jgi:hypothetical protein
MDLRHHEADGRIVPERWRVGKFGGWDDLRGRCAMMRGIPAITSPVQVQHPAETTNIVRVCKPFHYGVTIMVVPNPFVVVLLSIRMTTR